MIIAKSQRIEVRQLRTALVNGEEDDPTSSATAANSIINAATPFPVLWSVPVNGRITAMSPLKVPSSRTSYLFITTDQLQYAVIGYNPTTPGPYPVTTHASGSLHGDEFNILGRPAECGPLVAVDPHNRCVMLHLYDGLLTIFPIQHAYIPPDPSSSHGVAVGRKSSGSVKGGGGASSPIGRTSSVLAPPFHSRMEERTILSLTMLHHLDATITPPHVCLLHQDSRGAQHITTHAIDLQKHQVWFLGQAPGSVGGPTGSGVSAGGGPPPSSSQCEWLKKSRIDGGSSLLIPVPARAQPAAAAPAAAGAAPPDPTTGYFNSSASNTNHSGGVVILGQRQITYCALNHYKVMPIPPALLLSWDYLPPDVSGNPRYLIGDEFGNLHMLTLITSDKMNKVIALQLDTLGSCTLSSQLVYLNHGLVFCGSKLGDSQLIQIHDEPIPVDQDEPDDSLELGDTTYLSVVEEYTHLGPIVDFDLVPTTPGAAAATPATVDPTAPAAGPVGAMAGGVPASSSPSTGVSNPMNSSPTSVVQSQVVTASGSSKSGTVRVIRNGIGMKEYASVELGGIQNMWSLRQSFDDTQDAFLVQSFVGETRVLGVSTGEPSSRSGEDDPSSLMENESKSNLLKAGDDGTAPMEQEDDEVMGEDDEDEEEVGGTLEEVVLPGLESNASTLYVSNVVGDLFLQITESQLRLASNTGELLDTWSPPREDEEEDAFSPSALITVATANEAGQIAIALRGGMIMYFHIRDQKLKEVHSKRMDREVSCINLNPFTSSLASQNHASFSTVASGPTDMEVDGVSKTGAIGARIAQESKLVAVGLWDDFTVRLLSLEAHLAELVQIHLSTNEEDDEEPSDSTDAVQGQRRNRNNMMARSLCLITLDFHHSSSGNSGTSGNESSNNLGGGVSNSNKSDAPGVNMLFVGLGDGTLVSFAVVKPEDGRAVTVHSKKEVSLGTQRINLVPLHTEGGGTCVLATGDRPTVIYLAGIGGSSSSSTGLSSDHHFNPKLCYSNVNLSAAPEDDPDSSMGVASPANDVSRPHTQQSIAVNVASPFNSPLLFDALGHGEQQQYSLCVADDVNLRLGVIDDIQKLHVTTCRLGMAPRRIVHCPEGRLFAVGCVESGIKQFGLGGGEMNMGNLIRFLDDTTLDDIDR